MRLLRRHPEHRAFSARVYLLVQKEGHMSWYYWSYHYLRRPVCYLQVQHRRHEFRGRVVVVWLWVRYNVCYIESLVLIRAKESDMEASTTFRYIDTCA